MKSSNRDFLKRTQKDYNLAFKLQIIDNFCDDGVEVAIEGKLVSNFYKSNGSSTFYQEIEVNDLIIL